MEYQKGDEIEVVIDKFVFGGSGIAKKDGLVIFVDNAMPGDKVLAKIFKTKKNYIEAKNIKLIEESKDKIVAKCPWFQNCGGCKYQNISYQQELEWKETHVKESLERIGGFKDLDFKKIIKSPKEWFYRNKIELSVGPDEKGQTEIGYHKAKDYRTTLPIDQCLIFDEKLPEILKALREYIKENRFEYYDMQNNPNGFLQFVVLRRSEFDNELQINIVTRDGELRNYQKLINKVSGIKPKFSLFQTINTVGNSYRDNPNKKLIKLYGNDVLVEKLSNLKFRVSPFSFFQTNTLGATKLYQTILDFADLKGTEKVLDLYCGTGTIGQFLAPKAKEVLGIELVKDAIIAAEENAKLNGLNNCSYEAGDTRKVLKFNREKYLNPDVIITDPPRSGMVLKTLVRMAELKAKKIIYVSCNPAMLGRDLKDICTFGYKIGKVQPVDMFPHTEHVETVVELNKF